MGVGNDCLELGEEGDKLLASYGSTVQNEFRIEITELGKNTLIVKIIR